ncbi:MAG: branched-chain amino acid transporter substrate-binding protein [Ilumatobacteraceae bacterium]|nr:branched-chain amino acid transporter substrate-binding protein [Ilumatobacteraceae bacterium]
MASVYAPLIKGFKAYIDQANASHLLGDVQINLVVADDQGDPTLTPAAVGGLIDAHADVVSGILGSANNLAVRSQLNSACIPQLMALGNSARLGDVAAAPWTMGALVPVTVETTVYVNSIVRMQGEDAKVALLVSDDSDGQTFASSFTDAASATSLQLTGQQLVEPDVIVAPNAQLLAIAADRPDAIVASLTGASCATFLIELAKVRLFYPDWNPTVYISGGCADPSILALAGPAAEAVYSSANLVTDEPTFDAAMAGLGITDGLAAAGEGWTAAEVTVAILRQAAASPAGLTRASIMDAARHLSYTPSLARPGVHYVTNGTEDPFPAESLQVIQFHVADHAFTDVGPLIAQFES